MNETVSFTWILLKVVFFTGVLVLLAIVLLRFGLPYFYRAGKRRERHIEIMEMRMLTREHTLALVRVAHHYHLIGLSRGNLQILATYAEEAFEEKENLVQES